MYVLCQIAQNVLIGNIHVVESNEICLGNLKVAIE
jgi:hypothetical protein